MRATNISKIYGEKTALSPISFSFNSPASVAVIGHNGSGKTTLLEILMGLTKPNTGNVDFSKETEGVPLKERIGVVLQENNFYEDATVMELLRLFRTYYDQTYDLGMLIEMLGIHNFVDKRYSQLSGGMKQKVNLALAFLNKPAVAILDEPTTGLDPVARAEFWDSLDTLCHGRLLFLSSHYMSEVQEHCSHVLFLNDSRLVYAGTIKGLLAEQSCNDLSDVYLKIARERQSS
ncbi:ABC transporter ATP-binding protein [Actinomyces qiguomingii]|uniref:ABC transporter ATP-binding protein n=1 Tax=Actinomyces qiguomingii TaxID=2057800 RepID=UPI000CA07F3E|nr:ABC transporter ATP-binding protein [Actinomyces qiguomingii]